MEAGGHNVQCHVEFVANEVLKFEGINATTTKEGPFEGTCNKGLTTMKFEAVTPVGVGIEVVGLPSYSGHLGLSKLIVLDGKTKEDAASVASVFLDKNGKRLSLGATRGITTWSNNGCEKVAKIAAYSFVPADPNSEAMQIFRLGSGTCTINATMMGITGSITVSVP
jgi:hypothetical protein